MGGHGTVNPTEVFRAQAELWDIVGKVQHECGPFGLSTANRGKKMKLHVREQSHRQSRPSGLDSCYKKLIMCFHFSKIFQQVLYI